MKPKTKAALAILAAVAAVWLAAWPVYLALPDVVPAHMNLAGNVDRWGSKLEVLIMPLIFTFVGLAAAAILYAAPVEMEKGQLLPVYSFVAMGALVALAQPLATFLSRGDGVEMTRFMVGMTAAIVIITGLAMPALSEAAPPRPFCGLPSAGPLPTPEASRKAAWIGRWVFAFHGSAAFLLNLAGLPPTWTVVYLVCGLLVLAVGMCFYSRRYLGRGGP
ncbi:DUF1648 domain-containing protein [Oceanithermus sp.]